MKLLRLHTDYQGSVWYGDDVCLAEDTGEKADTFCAGSTFAALVADAGVVRMLGVTGNAALLLRTQEAVVGGRSSARVQVCGPLLCRPAQSRSDPVWVLQKLWQPTPADLAQVVQHDVRAHDFCTYALIDALQRSQYRLTDLVLKYAACHPAWPALTFAPSCSPAAACRLVAEVVDPRWYRHPARPGRLSRLFCYLGLTRDNVDAVYRGRDDGVHFAGTTAAVRSWYPGWRPAVGPRDYLYRIVRTAPTRSEGVLAATKRLVMLVHLLWSAALGAAPFVPERFFRGEGEAEAFRAHVEKLKVDRRGGRG